MKTLLLILLICILSTGVESCGTVTNTQCDSIVTTFSTIAHALCSFVQSEVSAKNLSSFQAESISTTMLIGQVASLKTSMRTSAYNQSSKNISLSGTPEFLQVICTLDSLENYLVLKMRFISGG